MLDSKQTTYHNPRYPIGMTRNSQLMPKTIIIAQYAFLLNAHKPLIFGKKLNLRHYYYNLLASIGFGIWAQISHYKH